MITASEARSLMDYQHLEEKIKEYENIIEKDIMKAAKDNMSYIMITIKDNDNLLGKALCKTLDNFTNNGFEVAYTRVNYNRFVVSLSW